jgi:hypothetical protein
MPSKRSNVSARKPARKLPRRAPRVRLIAAAAAASLATGGTARPVLSAPDKMPRESLTWSTVARDNCPGSRDASGNIVPACVSCYAAKGRYLFPNTRAPRIHNAQDYRNPGWVAGMVAAIKPLPYFRWFDSGDVDSRELAELIEQVIAYTPGTRHWLPTRSHKIPAIREVLERIATLPNVAVRYSSDSVHGETVEAPQSSTIISTDAEFDALRERVGKGLVKCLSGTRGGKCGDCRACWHKAVRVVAYPIH